MTDLMNGDQSTSRSAIPVWCWWIVFMLFLATVVGIIYVTLGTRRIPIQHAKRQVGNRMTQSSSSFLPRPAPRARGVT